MDAYEQVRVIGKGSFGVVSEVVRKSDGKVLVWKEVNYGAMSEKEKQLIVSEVNILRDLRHPHIVRYLDRVIDKKATKIYIVMEYCEGGDLSQFIKRKKREGAFIDEDFIWHVFTHIYLALRECHRHREGNVVRPILHRDIKPGNIFLDSNGNAKLGDFGLAKELQSESRFAQTNVGTPYYMSPEMVNEMTYDERSDIWALGCLLYEMATLAPPFDATNQLALAKKINAGRFARIPGQYSEGLFQAIRWQLHRQRSRRPRVEDLERIPELQQRLRAYAAANPVLFQSLSSSASTTSTAASSASSQSPDVKQWQATYNQKMKELLLIEEDLRRQEAALEVREKKLKEQEVELLSREAILRKRELLGKKANYSNETMSNAMTSEPHTYSKQALGHEQANEDSGADTVSSPLIQEKEINSHRSISPDQLPDSPCSTNMHSAEPVSSRGSKDRRCNPGADVFDNGVSNGSLAAKKLNKDCRMTTSLDTHTRNHHSDSLRKQHSAHLPSKSHDNVRTNGGKSVTNSERQPGALQDAPSSVTKVRKGNVVSMMKGLWKKSR